MLIVTRNASRTTATSAIQRIGSEGRRPLAPAEADPQHAREQVDEREVGERHRDADLAAVEEQVRDAEREQDEQVEVGDPAGPAEVEQADEEDQRHRDPDVGGVEHVAELPLVAARHRPGDLIAGPGLEDRPRVAVHLHLHDLVGAALVADLPEPVVVDLDRGHEPAVAGALLGDLRVGVGDLDRLRRRDREVLGGGREIVGLRRGGVGRARARVAVGGEREDGLKVQAASASAAARIAASRRTSTACCR